MNIIFAGTPDFAAVALSALLNDKHHIIAVYTQPDRKSGRGQKVQLSPVKQVAQQANLPVYQPLNFKADDDIQTLKNLKPDLMIVAAYGLLLPQAVLDIPKYGCINIHASLLPRWRGAAPIHRAIQAGDSETGITIMQMDKGLDTGDMLYKKSLPILEDDTGGTLHDKLAELGGKCMLHVLNRFKEISPEKQDDQHACYAKKLNKQEAQIDWTLPANQIERLIRAFNPWPVCFSYIDDQVIRIHKAKLYNHEHHKPPGTVISFEREHLRIACGQHAIDILELQLPGGKRLSVSDVFNSKKDLFLGKQFK